MADDLRTVRLQDGAIIHLRPVRPDDKALFVDAFERLTPDSRYRRFLSPHGRLTDRELRYFTEVDHHDHEAIVALDARNGDGIGVARSIRFPEHPETAEFAVTVTDDWQGRGVGTALLHELVERARGEGISRATATVLVSNRPSIELLREVGDPHVRNRDGGVEEVLIDLPEDGVGDLGAALRHAADSMPDARRAPRGPGSC
jgi:GNAT superfamily N-acetyltransferase